MTSGNVVYQFFDAAGSPLYIGSTVDTKKRFARHRDFSEWWEHADHTRTVILNFATEAEKIDCEQSEIARLKPAFNVAGVAYAYTPPRPNRPRGEAKETPPRKIRFSDRDWSMIQKAAAETGETASGYVRRFLIQYVKDLP